MDSASLTIYALSSGQVPSGIAIVRVSGPKASSALLDIAGVIPSPRTATRAWLRDANGLAIDDALALWFPAPRSATGEDVAEFHVHGGRAVIAALVKTLAEISGLRPAEPGEFTRRAFENGKLDLIAAEALDDLIHADTEQQRRQALRQLGGLLGDRARDWRQRMIDVSALVEAGIDFSDEGDVATETLDVAREAVASLRTEIDAVLVAGKRGERLREGLNVVIAGPPNVGKSTLLNTIARRDLAIVTPYAGTTRDVVEAHLDLDGYPVTLIDTAGLRDATDPVEQEGIRRAMDRAAAADLVLWLTDLDAVAPQEFDVPVWMVRTKSDLGETSCSIFDHAISSTSGEGIEQLTAGLIAFAATHLTTEAAVITRARHRELLEVASADLQSAQLEDRPELIAEDLRRSSHAIGQLLGHIDVEDVLGSIFSRFCIGK